MKDQLSGLFDPLLLGRVAQDHVQGQVQVLQVGERRRDEARMALLVGHGIAERPALLVESVGIDRGALAGWQVAEAVHACSVRPG